MSLRFKKISTSPSGPFGALRQMGENGWWLLFKFKNKYLFYNKYFNKFSIYLQLFWGIETKHPSIKKVTNNNLLSVSSVFRRGGHPPEEKRGGDAPLRDITNSLRFILISFRSVNVPEKEIRKGFESKKVDYVYLCAFFPRESNNYVSMS